jgi:putative oxidoreductase
VSYAEFALPICLLLGFGTRIAAFGLLLISLMIQFYGVPFAPWSMHLYWSLTLVVLMSLARGNSQSIT